ncbi:hypothetical protein [Paraliomyxa miuraensis]|uniref:hypothetical protein n=1 Tax=Paraliomyxa miuraensis TaxID=376150 RepID=UPI00225B266C|nr:hypothetical protein [Paraliomyxa miuraensis]MCX4240822.1 hypothetical protein [Paraliomyxa miuraensis]
MHASPRRGAAVVLLLLAACAEDRQPPSDDTTSGGSTTGEAGSTTGQPMPDLPAGDESTGPSWPLPTDDDLLTCVRTCELPSDCCPPGSEGQCPGGTYPHNYSCVDGLCIFPPCLADTDCLGEGEQCLLVRGYPSCVLPCDGDDAPCMAIESHLTCSGTTDEGQSYCLEHCGTAGVFCGNQTCDQRTGECVCADAGQCIATWDCV